MINIPTIQTCFETLIGFKQNKNTNSVEIEPDLLVSDSGIYVQGIHALLTIENLQNCLRESSDNLNEYLRTRRNDAISKLINSIYTKKQVNLNSKELLNEVRLYDGSGNFRDKIAKLGRFVGFRVTMKDSDTSLLMSQIGLQFDTAQDKLPIYIYHTSQEVHLYKLELDYTTKNSFAWKQLTTKLTLPYVRGGGYIIGYYEDDITGQAINRNQIFQRMPGCYGCDQLNYNYYSKWFKHINIQPITIDSANLNEDRIKWDEQNESWNDGFNYGLNLCISIHCDMSDLFCRNRELFANALSLQIADCFLEDIANSTRDNQLQQKVSNMANYARGNKADTGADGIQNQLARAIDALDFNISDVSKVCMPCTDEGQRINIKSVYK